MSRKSYKELADILNKAKENVQIQCLYKHYKWQRYRVESLATLVDDDRNLQTMVVYRPEWEQECIFVRNIDIFEEIIEREWEEVKRFAII